MPVSERVHANTRRMHKMNQVPTLRHNSIMRWNKMLNDWEPCMLSELMPMSSESRQITANDNQTEELISLRQEVAELRSLVAELQDALFST